jgi:hypothetical protein
MTIRIVHTEKIYQQKFLPVGKYLLKELDYYGEKQFRKQTPVSVWTIGQWYDYIIEGSYAVHFNAIQNCLNQKNGSKGGGKTLLGIWVFTFKKFPPFKNKISAGYDIPVQIESPSKAKDKMYGFIKEMHKLAIQIDRVGPSGYKVKHPVLGMLTAEEWYRLIVLQLQHHLGQKRKVDKVLRTFVKEVEPDDTALQA